MMREATKAFRATVKAVDGEAPGTFEALVSAFGVVDSDNEVVAPGAFKATLEANPNPPIVWSHRWDQVPIGETISARETADGLLVKGRLFVGDGEDHAGAREVCAAMRGRALKEFSWSGSVVKETRKDDGVVQLDQVSVAEWGPCVKGANPATGLVGAVKTTTTPPIPKKEHTLSAVAQKRVDREIAEMVNEKKMRAGVPRDLLDDPDVRKALERAVASSARISGMTLGTVLDREALKADISGTPSMRLGTYQGIVPQLTRPLTVLDLLPMGVTDGNVVPYTVGGGTFLAVETAEGSAKPEDGVTFTDATAPVQTIAAWQKILKQGLSDYAGLRSMISNRLTYSVKRRLEAQVINGNGTAPNLRGILNTSGIGSIAFDAGTEPADLILQGIGAVIAAGGTPDGVLLSSADWMSMLSAKSGGSGEYFSGGPFSVSGTRIWGLPAAVSATLATGTALVGGFAQGAEVVIRQGVEVLLSQSDGDDFLRNRVTLLAELRAALPVWQPSALVKVALSA